MPQKWIEFYEQKRYESHKKRLREAKTTIDKTKPPPMPMSMRRDLERRREQQAIEQDNRLLLDRLADAMNRKNIDNILHPQHIVSFNNTRRTQNLKKIYEENQVILNRIQTTPPYYKSITWEKDNEQRIEYLKNMTEFPHLFVPPGTKKRSDDSSSPLNTSSFKTMIGSSSQTPEGFMPTNAEQAPSPPPELIPQNFPHKSSGGYSYGRNRIVQSVLPKGSSSATKLPNINN